jgi:CelD/BcsL family acetyltransferase involved in cellulose biosynthesis
VTTLAAELVVCDSRLEALRAEWHALWRGIPSAMPFQSPSWLLSWWHHFGTGLPRVAVLRDHDGRLLGVLPLYVLDEPPAAKLLPIGVSITDYCDALIASDAPSGAARVLLREALTGAGIIASCDLVDLPPDAKLHGAVPPVGWHARVSEAEPCPVLSLRPGCVPGRQRRKLRMARHRADRLGAWDISLGGLDALAALIRLHEARWTARGEPSGVLADHRVRAFLEEAAPALLSDGVLRLYTLCFGQNIAAVVCVLLAGTDRVFLYMSGFDAAFAYESPGTILIGHIIEQALSEGRRELHFLRGGEGYKYAWGAADRHNVIRVLEPESR